MKVYNSKTPLLTILRAARCLEFERSSLLIEAGSVSVYMAAIDDITGLRSWVFHCRFPLTEAGVNDALLLAAVPF